MRAAQPPRGGGRRAGRRGGAGGAAGLGLLRRAATADAPAEAARRPALLAYVWARRGERAHRSGATCCWSLSRSPPRVAVAVPLGLALERARPAAEAVIRGVGLLQTIPGIALLAFMIPLLGIGVVPALVALWLYSLYPIVRNTYTGVRDAGPEAVARRGRWG